MNKIEIIAKIKEIAVNYEIPVDQLIVSHGGAMVLHGLLSTTNDVDLTVPTELFNALVERGEKVIPAFAGRLLIQLTDDVDIHDYSIGYSEDALTTVDGITVTTVPQMLEDYLEMNRTKDQTKIAILRDLVNGKSNG